MNFKEALLFSKSRTTCYDSKDKQHTIKIEEMEEQYTPLFNFSKSEEPYFRIQWVITVHEVLEGVLRDPHKTHEFHSVESCEEFLKGWGINTEDGWYIPQQEYLQSQGQH